MKTLLKQITGAIAIFAFAATAFAATPNDSSSFNTMYVTDKALSNNNWTNAVTISEGELLSFELHYYLAEGVSATDMRFSMENLNQKTFSAGHTETVTGKITASNLSQANGSTQVTFADNVKLDLYNVSWQKYPCKSVGCETSLVDSYSKVITSNGMSIGNVSGDDSHYTGNVIVSYKVTKTSTPSPDTDADVTTTNPSNIDEDSARLNGSLDINDWNNADVYFKWGTSSSNLNNTTAKVSKNSDGSFNKTISGLSDDTTYYYRAYAKNPSTGEVVYGSLKNFRTDDDGGSSSNDGDVTTRTPSNIDEDSARLNGEWEGDDNTDVWFAFSRTDSTPSCSDSSQKVGETDVDDNETFSETVSNLRDNTTYYYRACGEDSDGSIVSGSIKQFTTDEEDDDDNNSDDVDVTTNSPSNIDEDSARLNGEMDGDDNVDVWFAFSRTDSTPSCNVSSQRVGKTDADDGDDFSETVTNLVANTKYYYRACAEDNDGSIVSGSIRNFVTDEDDDNSNPSGDDLSTVTNVASNITTTSARLNSIILGEGNATCYFQYGRTTSLGLTSPLVAVDLDDDSTCSSVRTGLASNSTYYFRSVLIQDGNVEYGTIRSFRTNRFITGGPTPVPTNPTPTNTNTTVTIVNQNVDVTEEGLSLTKWVSAEDDARFDDETTATPGETVYYKVRVTNTSGEDLNNVVVTDRIPFELELSEDRSLDDDDDKRLTWVINLDEGESRTFITEMRLREDVREGDTISSFATAEAEDDDFFVNSNDVIIDVERSSTVTAGQGANLFGAGFLPTTLFGWLVLLLVILAIAYFISRILVSRNENQRVLAELAAARAARNNG